MVNVFYEEAGALKVGNILADNTTSLQIESVHGKRSKIKAGAVLLRFENPPMHEFMQQAQEMAAEIDVDFLWECCEENNEFTGQELANDYFGHTPNPVEIAAITILLNQNPIYFHKKGTGRYKAAPPEILRAALASREKKRLAEEKQAGYVQQLVAFELPDTFRPLLDDLLYKPDKNTIEWKALEAACAATRLSVPRLLEQCGAIPSTHDYHFNQFLYEHFPEGTSTDSLSSDFHRTDPEDFLLAKVTAFSIDDAATTEIDDAFSVTPLTFGSFRIGIHIATPALGVAPDSLLDKFAAKRLSTVYLPGRKITMLPESVIQHFTLSETRRRPVLSLYLDVADDFTVTNTLSRIETIEVSTNLRLDVLEQQFNEITLRENQANYPFAHELRVLWDFSNKMEKLRGKDQDINSEKVDYSFTIEQDRVSISERRRGAPIDKVVSELMIFANAEWGKQLADAGFAGIYRSQGNGKVKMSLSPAPHQGLGVSQYTWSSSPMRRYVDLINQRQLIALVSGNPPAYTREDDALLIAMRDFEMAYATYAEFQRGMERYWCLRWLLQENINTTGAVVVKENLVKLDRLPLIARVPSLPDLSPGTFVTIGISQIDLLDRTLHASFLGKRED
ncbi:exoribonuclease-2 [Nitrosomonas eutropha]|uniref:ribonuclease catalytic domain-containing protein n=1 Tax=Nitrosomonas TaxID=914 RepID=UPI000894DD4A|nr:MULTISPECIES: RNB domain-containing ribonuclease [Nitrosomonas]MXS79666.1 RNB domain-containing ribonuclease [Nitrosomonas sp. GH22]SDW24192.1 exoribonuclease-2 [Nitrosomonas eutropha]